MRPSLPLQGRGHVGDPYKEVSRYLTALTRQDALKESRILAGKVRRLRDVHAVPSKDVLWR